MSRNTYGPTIDYSFCTSCTTCYEECPMDIFGWDEEKNIPLVLYPGECALCCVCEMICPELAIDVRFPLHTLMEFGIDPENVIKRSMTNYAEKK